jgi:PRC-barrel domain
MLANRLMRGAGLSCWLLFAAMPAVHAQDRVQVEPREKVAARAGTRRITEVIGARVTIQNNLSVGKVEDLVINENGCIDYLVVLNEDKYVLVPWTSADVSFERRAVAIEIAQERFREVPTFTRDRWPNLSDRAYVEKLNTYYGVRPGRERRIERRQDRRP